jgi:hypothetical protein
MLIQRVDHNFALPDVLRGGNFGCCFRSVAAIAVVVSYTISEGTLGKAHKGRGGHVLDEEYC